MHSLDFNNIDNWMQNEESYVCKVTSNIELEEAKLVEILITILKSKMKVNATLR